MTKSGRREFFRRLLVMGVLTVGLVTFGYTTYFIGIGFIAGSIALYIYLPAVPIPKDALVYDTVGSQTVPDWLGFILSSLFFAGPVWAALSEPNWGTIHPSSMLLWPMALLSTSLWIIGALHASYWILITPKKLVVSSAFSKQEISFNSVQKARPYRRGLPGWLYFLMPLMVLKGQFGGAGSLLLAQDRTGIELIMKDGKSNYISDSGYGEEIMFILQTLDQHGVELAARYKKRLQKMEPTHA